MKASVKKKVAHGGKRPGAGRKPSGRPTKRKRTYLLSHSTLNELERRVPPGERGPFVDAAIQHTLRNAPGSNKQKNPAG
jgi:hypothetical protein